MALLQLFITCIVANAVVFADKCEFGDIEMEDFDIDLFTGQWYSIWEQPELVKKFNHFMNFFKISEDKKNKGIILSEAISNGQEVTYVGSASVKEDGTINYKAKDLDDFSGKYKVLDTDYNCYAILRGCPKNAPVKTLTWIQLRNATPSTECEEKVQKAAKDAGIDLTKFIRETYA